MNAISAIMMKRKGIKTCLFAFVGGVGAFFLLLLFCWVFVADGKDADERNAYIASLDTEYIRAEFAKEGVNYEDVTAWHTGVYSTIAFHVDRECRIPESVLNYMANRRLGYLMWVELMQGPPGAGIKIDSELIF